MMTSSGRLANFSPESDWISKITNYSFGETAEEDDLTGQSLLHNLTFIFMHTYAY